MVHPNHNQYFTMDHDNDVQKGDILFRTLCLHILTESPLSHDRPLTVWQYNAMPHCSPPPLDWAAADVPIVDKLVANG